MKTINENQAAPEMQFMIQRVYLKDSSFETNNTPAIFQQEWKPDLALNLQIENKTLETNTYEVVLTVTATIKNQNETAFLVEVKQAGIFTIIGAPEGQLAHLLGSFCPSLLFPYAREAISSKVARGSFPQLVLAPINFDAIYMQQMEENQRAAMGKTEAEVGTH
jgi:preprotein translocase subunit SecB